MIRKELVQPNCELTREKVIFFDNLLSTSIFMTRKVRQDRYLLISWFEPLHEPDAGSISTSLYKSTTLCLGATINPVPSRGTTSYATSFVLEFFLSRDTDSLPPLRNPTHLFSFFLAL